MNTSANLFQVIQGLAESPWMLVIMVGGIIPLLAWVCKEAYYGLQEQRQLLVENNRLIRCLVDGSMVPGSTPAEYVTQRALMDVTKQVAQTLQTHFDGSICPIKDTMIQLVDEANARILRRLDAFQSRAEISRAETAKLAEGINADVKLIIDGLLPVISEFSRSKMGTTSGGGSHER